MEMPLIKNCYGRILGITIAVFVLFAFPDNKSGITFGSSAPDVTGEACFHDNNSTGDFEKGIKIPRLTDTDYVIFLTRSAKENIQLSYKVKVTT